MAFSLLTIVMLSMPSQAEARVFGRNNVNVRVNNGGAQNVNVNVQRGLFRNNVNVNVNNGFGRSNVFVGRSNGFVNHGFVNRSFVNYGYGVSSFRSFGYGASFNYGYLPVQQAPLFYYPQPPVEAPAYAPAYYPQPAYVQPAYYYQQPFYRSYYLGGY